MASRPAPPGYDKPGVGAMIKADKEFWTLVARECRDGCKPTAAGTCPLDSLVEKHQNDSVVAFCLGSAVEPHTKAKGTRGKEIKESQGKARRAKAAGTSPRGAQASGRLCRKSCAICPPRMTRADVTATDGT